MVFFHTDKTAHGYLPTYLEIASLIGKNSMFTDGHVCELGVFRGQSLEMWQALLPKGVIAGVDNDPDSYWPGGTHKLLFDQDDEKMVDRLIEISPMGWDLIVDDCSHKGELTRKSWELLWPIVKPGGFYIIEDWFVGLPPWINGQSVHGDPEMLTTAESFLKEFCFNGIWGEGNMESATYKHGLIILRKMPLTR